MAVLTAGGPTSFCLGESVVLLAAGGASYQFLRNGQPIVGATASSYTATTTGLYAVTVTNSFGCTNTAAATPVTVKARPAAPTVTSIYSDSTIILNSSAAIGNQWYQNGTPVPGATTPTLVVNPAQYATYTVITTSTNGCASPPSAPLVITSSLQQAVGTSLTVYPNPTFDGKLLVEFSGYYKPVSLTISTTLGQTVYHRMCSPGQVKQVLDLSSLLAGVYVLRAVSAEGTTFRRIVRY